MAPETENPLPVTVAAVIVTATVPVDVSVTVCVVAVFTLTLPNPMLPALTPSVAVPDPSCNEKVVAVPPALAVNVAVCPVLTDDTVAVKLPVVAPAATVMLAGTVTAELLLTRPTTNPPLAAAALSVTVQLSVPAPVIVPLVQVRPLNTGVPVPLKLIKVDVPLDELLVIVSEPEAAPATVGSNRTVSVAVWLPVKVIGNVTPETVKPVPAAEAALMVTPEVPPDERTKVCVAAVFTFTLPNDKLSELTFSAIDDAPSCTPKVSVTPFAEADKVTACATFTADTAAENVPLFWPLATVTAAGTTTAGLLLATLTANPPMAAAAFSVTVHVSVPAPVIDPLEQLSAVSAGTPVPLRVTAVDAPVEELLFKVSEPEAVPAAVGSNWTLSVTV